MTENLYTPGCIRTRSGIYLNVADPRPEMINIQDIAWSLSRQCRFGAHLPVFYTVAQHCVEVCDLLPDAQKLQGLLHEGFEGLGGMDLPGPVKKLIPGYAELEDRVMHVIAAKYGFDWPMHELTNQADLQELEFEWETYMLRQTSFSVWGMDKARRQFLFQFNELVPTELQTAINYFT